MPPNIFNNCVSDGSKEMVRNIHSLVGQFWLKAESVKPFIVLINIYRQQNRVGISEVRLNEDARCSNCILAFWISNKVSLH